MVPKISVLVPVYGVEKYIGRCARSLFGQTMTEGVEFVFVDDCTPDRSIEVLKSVAAEYPHVNIRIIRHEQNMGIAGARNTLIDNAKGEYTVQIDSDDWVEPTMLEEAWAVVERNGADIVGWDYVMDYPDKHVYVAQPTAPTGIGNVELLMLNKLHGGLWIKLVRRSLYSDNNIRTTQGHNMLEDFLLSVKLFAVAGKVGYIPKAFLHYIQHGKSTTAQNHRDKTKDIVYAIDNAGQFLEERGLAQRLRGFIIYRKLLTKLVFLKNNRWRRRAEYREIYPEIKPSMLEGNPAMPVHLRAILWLADRFMR